MTNDEIRRIAIEHRFPLTEDADGCMNPEQKLFDFARALIDASGTDRDLHRQHIANMVCDRLPTALKPKSVDVSSMLVAVSTLTCEYQYLLKGANSERFTSEISENNGERE